MKPTKNTVLPARSSQKTSVKKMRHSAAMFSIAAMQLFFSHTSAQTVTTIIGNGTAGTSGNGGQATAASIDLPDAIAITSSGKMLITDYNCIRKVNTSGIISISAGTTASGYSGDGGPATAAEFRNPSSIVLDASGNIYFTDVVYNVVRKIDASGIISTVAGNGSTGYYGDNGPATAAELNSPVCIAIDASGNLLISDYLNYRIRKVDASGTITTIAGTGTPGFSGDNGQATAAEIYTPAGIVTDASGDIYFADASNYTIRKIDASGIITTIAGTGVMAARTQTGDGNPATADSLDGPYGIVLDKCGNVYFSEPSPGIIRKIDESGILTTIAGTWTCGYNGDGGAATATQFNSPMGIVFDASGNLIVSDFQNYRYRAIASVAQVPPQAAPTNDGPICVGGIVDLYANSTGATAWSWTGPGGFTSSQQNPTATPTATGVYSLTVSGSGCSTSTVYTTTVTVNALPTVYNLLPSSGAAGSVVYLNSSDGSGIRYQLYDHTTAVGSPLTGVNFLLSFGSQGNGTYTVIATDISTSCSSEMNGTSVIGTGLRPSAPAVTQSQRALSVIPNPNKGDFVIKGDLETANDQPVTVAITDLLGQIIYTASYTAVKGNLNERIILEHVANGIYMLSLHTSTVNDVFQIVVAR